MPPHRRPGARRAAHRRPRRHRAGAASTRWRSTRPARRRSTPGSRRKEGDLLAYQLSEGGTEESVLRVLDVATGDGRRRPDRPRALLPGRLAARRRGVLLRAPARTRPGARRTRSSTTAGSGCTGSAPTRPSDVLVFGDGLDKTNYYGVHRVDGRPLAVRRRPPAGTAPRNDLWLADLTVSTLEAPALRVVQDGVDAQHRRCTSAATAGPTCSPTATPRAAGSRSTRPTTRRTSTGPTCVPEDDEAVLEDFAILDGPELGDAACCSAPGPGTRSARSPCTTCATGERDRARCRCPASARSAALAERPEGGHEAWFGYTDHVTPSSVYRYDATAGETDAVGDGARHGRRTRGARAGRWSTRPTDGTTVRMFVLVARPRSPTEPRPDGALRLRRLRRRR